MAVVASRQTTGALHRRLPRSIAAVRGWDSVRGTRPATTVDPVGQLKADLLSDIRSARKGLRRKWADGARAAWHTIGDPLRIARTPRLEHIPEVVRELDLVDFIVRKMPMTPESLRYAKELVRMPLTQGIHMAGEAQDVGFLALILQARHEVPGDKFGPKWDRFSADNKAQLGAMGAISWQEEKLRRLPWQLDRRRQQGEVSPPGVREALKEQERDLSKLQAVKSLLYRYELPAALSEEIKSTMARGGNPGAGLEMSDAQFGAWLQSVARRARESKPLLAIPGYLVGVR